MSDRRVEILNNAHRKEVTENGTSSIHTYLFPDAVKTQALNAMDIYMTECVLEFIEYVAKNSIVINNDNGEACCYLSNGEGITPKQLFDNFL